MRQFAENSDISPALMMQLSFVIIVTVDIFSYRKDTSVEPAYARQIEYKILGRIHPPKGEP